MAGNWVRIATQKSLYLNVILGRYSLILMHCTLQSSCLFVSSVSLFELHSDDDDNDHI